MDIVSQWCTLCFVCSAYSFRRSFFVPYFCTVCHVCACVSFFISLNFSFIYLAQIFVLFCLLSFFYFSFCLVYAQAFNVSWCLFLVHFLCVYFCPFYILFGFDGIFPFGWNCFVFVQFFRVINKVSEFC